MSVGNWVKVAELADVTEDTGYCVEVDGFPIALWNVDGAIYATQDSCTHEETSLSDGDLWDEVVECPLHGAQFDVRTGAVLSLPAVFPLKTFPVKVEDESIYLEWSD
jgi:3-phenylpropionate/trans-cinnamate dioxygenase ferredoxin subunit